MLTLQVNKALNNGSSKTGNNTRAKTNVIPAMGIGLAAGLPNMVQGLKNKKSYIVYSFYDAAKNPIAIKKVLLKKQNNTYIFDEAASDGFLKAIIIGNNKKVIAGNLDISIAAKEPMNFKGQMAADFNLTPFGDCQGGGGDDGGIEGTTCSEKYQIAVAKCKQKETTCNTGCDNTFPILLFPILNAACHAICTIGYNSCHDNAEKAYTACVGNL